MRQSVRRDKRAFVQVTYCKVKSAPRAVETSTYADSSGRVGYFVRERIRSRIQTAIEDELCYCQSTFGQSWGGKDADDGVEQAVKADQALQSTDGREGRSSIRRKQAMHSYSSSMLWRGGESGEGCYHFKRFASVLRWNDIWGESQIRRYILAFIWRPLSLYRVNFSTILESVSISGFIIRIRVRRTR